MRVFKLLLIIFFVFLVSTYPLISQTGIELVPDPQQQSSEGIIAFVRFQNKRVYYTETPISLRVSIKNNSENDFILQLADDPALNLNVRVKTLTNVLLRPSEAYFSKIFRSQPFIYRLINLRPGEEYSFSFDVRQFAQIDDPGAYVIETEFIANQLSDFAHLSREKAFKDAPIFSLLPPSENTSWLKNSNSKYKNIYENNSSEESDSSNNISSGTVLLPTNTLGLTIRPAIGAQEIKKSLAEDTGEILSRISLAPDEVVKYTLEARQKDLWNKFFLYMNLESLFLNNPDRSRRYRTSDTETRKYMIENFRTQIMNQELKLGISDRPHVFGIISVYYTDNNARVLTRQVYQNPQYQEIKEYIWFLRKENGFWTICDYTVKALGTQ